MLFPGFGFVPGHESIGIVEQIGDAAADRWHVNAGQRVAVEVFLSCRACEQCMAGEYRRCARHGLRDMYGFVDVDRSPGLWGGYAERQYLAPDSMLLPVPAGLDPIVATLFNPIGAGIGQLAYNYDGKVFTCDEGRMLHEMGDSSFLLGDVRTSKYRDLVSHETVRAVNIASNLDAQPDCVNCAYNPYCGIVPAHNHKTQGSIFGKMWTSTLCYVHKHIQDYLFEKLGEGDPGTLDTFQKWTTNRVRDHFLHPADPDHPR